MNDIERALAQISDIRAQLAASTRFRGYAPEVLFGIAILAALLTIAQMLWPQQIATDNVHNVVIWGAFLILSNLAMGAEAISHSRWTRGGMAPAVLLTAVRIQLPVTVVGIVIAYAVCRFAPETAWIVPGIWLLLMSLVVFFAHAVMPRAIVWAALWYALTGTASIMFSGQAGQFSPWMMGAPLFLGHLFVARLLKQEGDEPDVG